MGKNASPKVIVRAVISLHHGAKTKVELGSEFCEEFWAQVGVHQRFASSPLFVIAVNVIKN